MASDLDDIFNVVKKKSVQAEVGEVQRKREIENMMKELNLSESEYEEFLEKRDDYKPNLYDVSLALDDHIVNEKLNRLALFTAFVMGNIPVYVSGGSASGKTILMEGMIHCLMPGDILILEGSSDKAIFDQVSQIKRAKYLIIREINKINPMLFEILKSMGENKPFIYRRSGGLGSKLSEIEIPPRCFVFSKADESSNIEIPAELLTRVIELVVDSSQEQTIQVLARKAMDHENPFDIERVDLVQRAMLRYYISMAPDYDLYINPMSTKLIDVIPTVFTSSRRDFSKYMRNIAACSRFSYKDRIDAIIQDKHVLFVSPQDVFINALIFNKVLVQSSLRCSELEKLIIQVIKSKGSLSKQQVQSNLRTWSINSTIKTINSHLEHLTDVGYLEASKEGNQLFYTVSSFYDEFSMKMDFREIVDYCIETMKSIDYYKPYCEEYIQRYCTDDKLFVIDPFSGKTLDMLQYQFDSPLEVNEGTRMKADGKEVSNKNKNAVSLTDFM